MTTVDVVVVGGGPAGTAAAITLARAGRDVLVVDRARFPRDKCCGDGLTTAALRHLEVLGLDIGAVASWQVVEDVTARSPSGRTITFPFPRGQGTYAAVARRVDLDAALLDAARSSGAKVCDGHALVGMATGRDVAAADDRIALDVEGLGTVRARYAIGADGMWSRLRKVAGADDETGYLGEWHAFRQYFARVGPEAAGRLWVWFEPDLLPGYAWSFPLPDGKANVGFGVPRRPGRPSGELAAKWVELLARRHVREVLGDDAVPEAPHKAWPIPARVGATRLTAGGGRALFIGDAARAGDPMTGEGIAQALETAKLAAGAILDAGPFRPADAAAAYTRRVHRSIAVDNRLAGMLSRPLRHSIGARAAVRIAGSTDWTRRNFARWLFEDYPRAVLLTPRRWRRRVFTGPGTYRSAA